MNPGVRVPLISERFGDNSKGATDSVVYVHDCSNYVFSSVVFCTKTLLEEQRQSNDSSASVTGQDVCVRWDLSGVA